MKRFLVNPWVWIPCLLLSACGPKISGSDDGPEPSTSSPPTSTSASTTTATTMGPATSTDDTTSGPLDTVGITTDPIPPDFPEFCSIVEQDCPPGYKCAAYIEEGESNWYHTHCVPLARDPSAPGEPCTVEGGPFTGVDDCDGTSMCWEVDPDTLEGYCIPFCIGDDSNPVCADRCDHCTITSDGLLTICLPGCDPLAQDCPPGQACYPVVDDFACVTDDSPEGSGIASSCEFINVCPAGMACVNPALVPGCEDGALGCCAPFCPVGGADPCPGLLPGTECLPWYAEGGEPPEACVLAPPGVCGVPGA